MLVRDILSTLDSAPILSLDDLVGAGGLVILAPHPDDETLGCGGLIATACEQKRSVAIVFVTDGAASHPGSKSYPPSRLTQVRMDEAVDAATVLGVERDYVSFLALPDAAAPREGSAFDQAVEAIATTLERVGATALFVTWEHDPHCDHEAAAEMASAVCRHRPHVRLWRYPIWGLHRDPDTRIEQKPWRGARIDVSPWITRKRDALACHASQFGLVVDDDPNGFRLTSTITEPFLGSFERFIGDAA